MPKALFLGAVKEREIRRGGKATAKVRNCRGVKRVTVRYRGDCIYIDARASDRIKVKRRGHRHQPRAKSPRARPNARET